MRTTRSIPHWLTFALLLTASRANAQAWTQAPGHTYLKLSYGSATAGEQYGFDGQVKLYADDVYEPAFFDRSVYLYGETGLTESLTVAFVLPYKRVIVRDATYRYDTAALGDLELAARYALTPYLSFLPSSGVAAVNLKVGLPLGYDRNLLPAPGAGQVNLTASLDYGHAFGGWGYGQLGLGYRVRTPWYGLSSAVPCVAGVDRGCTADEQPDLGDEAVLRAEVGVRPWGPLLLQGLSEAVLSLEAPSVGFAVGETMPTRQRYVKVGAGVLVEPVAHLGLSAQAFVTPWGRNTVRSVDLFFGLNTDFDLWSNP
ncbi:MAG: hypothetical protein H6704_11265 [Myxococcales bacterium]|nr:hypothetical protein [Myxococcales bacterium]